MASSPEYETLKQCTSHLETAVKRMDNDLVHFLHREGFINDDILDIVLNPVAFVTSMQKASKVISCIKDRVKVDPHNYHLLVNGLKQGGYYYNPIVKTLEDVYLKQASLTQQSKHCVF
jgi:hypothetical protein